VNDIGGKIARGAGWVLTTVLSLAVGMLVAFGPIVLLPGPLHVDWVNGHWTKVAAMLFVLVVLTWRMASANEERRFTIAAGAAFMRVAVTAFALAFWPLGLLAWINGYGMQGAHGHDMTVTGIEETHIHPASTPVATYRLRELGSSWSADMEMTDEHRGFAAVGSCVRIQVVPGRLGLDWISDARPIPCPKT
jgi:hypothetical protein